MKKLVAVFVAILFCFWISSALVVADPGTEGEPDGTASTSTSTSTSTDYPPPPDGWEGPWPPPDWGPMLDGGSPPPAGDGGDDTGWADPTD